jgi:hypothetical protein
VAARHAAVTTRDRCQAAKKALELDRASKMPLSPAAENHLRNPAKSPMARTGLNAALLPIHGCDTLLKRIARGHIRGEPVVPHDPVRPLRLGAARTPSRKA